VKITVVLGLIAAQAYPPSPLPNYHDIAPRPDRGVLMCEATAQYLHNWVGEFGHIVRNSPRLSFEQQGTILAQAVNVTQPYLDEMDVVARSDHPERCADLMFAGHTALIEEVIRPVYGDYYACLKAGHTPEQC
jgi:hypothetical protein